MYTKNKAMETIVSTGWLEDMSLQLIVARINWSLVWLSAENK